MSILSLNNIRKKASTASGHGYLSTLLTTFDHVRTKKIISTINTINENGFVFNLKQVQGQGYSIIPNYMDKELCDQYCKEIDFLITKYPEYLHKNIDDQRIYGAENISFKIKSFSSNLFLQKIASIYNHTLTRSAFTLAAKLPFTPNNIGSGGGWHRDSCITQFKIILYLSNVTEKNGPFQLISHSNNLKFKLRDNKNANQPYMGYRYTNEQIEKVITDTPDRLITFNESAGTLILVDTSCIHRGKPIEEGNRYALFNYYFPEEKINTALFNQFSPLAQS